VSPLRQSVEFPDHIRSDRGSPFQPKNPIQGSTIAGEFFLRTIARFGCAQYHRFQAARSDRNTLDVRIPGDVNGAFRKNVNKDSEDVNKDSDGK
jgi:hypothetical protein